MFKKSDDSAVKKDEFGMILLYLKHYFILQNDFKLICDNDRKIERNDWESKGKKLCNKHGFADPK